MENIDISIFRAYDIRGVYPEELNEETALRIGRAYATLMQKENPEKDLTIAVGYDMRTSSPSLTQKVVEGLVMQGIHVVDIGLVSTPTFYFGVGNYGYDGGIMISASHNPAKYNGFKMTRAKAVPVSGDTGIMDIRDMVVANEFVDSGTVGSVTKREEVLAEQITHDLGYVDVGEIKPLTVVCDPANGMGGPFVDALFEELPCELVRMNWDLDGTFPNHEADPLKEENMKYLEEKVKEVGADIGIAPDGDGDRVFFVDEKGETIRAEIIRGMMAQEFLKTNPGAKIGYDVRPGKITEDLIREAGGIPVVTRVGHSLIKEQMLKEGIVFAGESSGHFYLNMESGAYEITMIVMLKMLERLSIEGRLLSEIVAEYRSRYVNSGEINLVVEDKDAVFSAIKEKYSDAKISELDGVSVTYPDYWFNVRASNTEPKIRLNLEATSKELMEEKRDEVLKVISGKKKEERIKN